MFLVVGEQLKRKIASTKEKIDSTQIILPGSQRRLRASTKKTVDFTQIIFVVTLHA
jgi:hypothetical protein